MSWTTYKHQAFAGRFRFRSRWRLLKSEVKECEVRQMRIETAVVSSHVPTAQCCFVRHSCQSCAIKVPFRGKVSSKMKWRHNFSQVWFDCYMKYHTWVAYGIGKGLGSCIGLRLWLGLDLRSELIIMFILQKDEFEISIFGGWRWLQIARVKKFAVTSGLNGLIGPTKHRLLIDNFSFKLHFWVIIFNEVNLGKVF